jgi:hypothetical protein
MLCRAINLGNESAMYHRMKPEVMHLSTDSAGAQPEWIPVKRGYYKLEHVRTPSDAERKIQRRPIGRAVKGIKEHVMFCCAASMFPFLRD